MMKKTLVVLLILVYLFSSFAFAQDETNDVSAQEPEPTPEPEPAVDTEPTPEPEQPVDTEPTPEPEQPVDTEPTPEPEQPVDTVPTTEPEQPVDTVPTTEPEQPVDTVPTTDTEPAPDSRPATEPINDPDRRICETFIDGAGCKVTNCNDGFHEQICPDNQQPSHDYDHDKKCWVGDQEVPCPDSPEPKRYLNVPAGCRVIVDSNGFSRVECQNDVKNDCPSDASLDEKANACRESGGQPTKRSTPDRCSFIECSFGMVPRTMDGQQPSGFLGSGGTCPTKEDIKNIESKCYEQGLRPVIRNSGGCAVVDCVSDMARETRCPQQPPEDISRSDCEAKGGKFIKDIREDGCMEFRCLAPEDATTYCKTDIPQNAFEKCKIEGGELTVKRDDRGCVIFFDCIRRGKAEDIEFEYIDEIPTTARVLSAVLKMESLKIQFDRLQEDIRGIAEYYDSEGKSGEAEKFYRAAGMFDAAKNKIEETKKKLKNNLQTLSPEDVMAVKYDLKYINEVVFKDILYVLLSAEGEKVPSEEWNSAQRTEHELIEDKFNFDKGLDTLPQEENCGFDSWCFEQNLRICKPSTFDPSHGTKVYIEGIDAGGTNTCVMRIVSYSRGNEQQMKCFYPNYAFGSPSADSILPYCKGELKKEFKRTGTITQTSQPIDGEMMGCDKVRGGISPEGVCGNGCCEENFGESHFNCQRDCMAPGMERVQGMDMAPQIERRFRQQASGGGGFVSNTVGFVTRVFGGEF
ncbi:MAG: hypothetical protein U9Q69_00550 [Nanoarchaeota archaeon]|nr:hypothetical protein [Nanoarchaeota archaeon]